MVTISPAAPVAVTPAVDRLAEARVRIEAYVKRSGGHLAVAVLDRRSEASVTVGSRRFQTASIVKVNILAAVLLRAQRRGRDLTSSARRLAASMITVSDNDAASTLWRQIGGAPGLAAANRTLGLRETRPNVHWGMTTTTAADQIRLLTALTTPGGPLSPENQRFLLDLMGRVDVDQSWGIPAAAGQDATRSYVKNGWVTVAEDHDRWLVNSIGRITEPDHDWLVAILSDHQVSRRAGIQVVEKAAKYALRELRTAARLAPP
jgi:beta-lactamase class A